LQLARALEHNLFLCPLVALLSFRASSLDLGPLSSFFLSPLCQVLCLIKFARVIALSNKSFCISGYLLPPPSNPRAKFRQLNLVFFLREGAKI